MAALYEDFNSFSLSLLFGKLEEQGCGLITFPSSIVMPEKISQMVKLWRNFCKRIN